MQEVEFAWGLILMRAENERVNIPDMWCHSSIPYDYVRPASNLDCLAQEWRCGGLTIHEARDNLLAHIIESRPRRRQNRGKSK
jgi:hypothetical protein